ILASWRQKMRKTKPNWKRRKAHCRLMLNRSWPSRRWKNEANPKWRVRSRWHAIQNPKSRIQDPKSLGSISRFGKFGIDLLVRRLRFLALMGHPRFPCDRKWVGPDCSQLSCVVQRGQADT